MSGQTKQKPKQVKKQQYCSIGQASAMLGVSIATLRRWEKAGKIKATRLDGKNRSFKITDLEKLNTSKPLSTAEVAKQLRSVRIIC
jgi:excisionase family DNA binding protein